MLWNTTWQGEYRVQQSAPSLWYCLSLNGTLFIAVPCMLWLRKPCLQRMSTLGILSLIGKMFPSTHTPFTPYAGATITLLKLYAWTYSSEPSIASTEFTEKSGDVILAVVSDYLISYCQTRRWQINLTTTDHVNYRTPVPWTDDYTHLWTIHLSLAHVFRWACPT